MKKIILAPFKDSLFNFYLCETNEIIGRLTVYSYKNNQGVVDLYIRKRWRRKWLSKEYAKLIYFVTTKISKTLNLIALLTRLNNPKSLRLLDFFGFINYSKNYYYLPLL